jgi:hypothetical protein
MRTKFRETFRLFREHIFIKNQLLHPSLYSTTYIKPFYIIITNSYSL